MKNKTIYCPQGGPERRTIMNIDLHVNEDHSYEFELIEAKKEDYDEYERKYGMPVLRTPFALYLDEIRQAGIEAARTKKPEDYENFKSMLNFLEYRMKCAGLSYAQRTVLPLVFCYENVSEAYIQSLFKYPINVQKTAESGYLKFVLYIIQGGIC